MSLYEVFKPLEDYCDYLDKKSKGLVQGPYDWGNQNKKKREEE